MLAVMTRNRLHSARTCLPMLRARALIGRQLATSPGLVRHAVGVAGPTEFLTFTVWESKAAMQAFMQSGAHERFMWLFSRWTRSFWGMRWEPSDDELGAWGGLRLSGALSSTRPVSPLVAAGLLSAEQPRAGPTGSRLEPDPVEPRGSGLFGATAVLEGARSIAVAQSVRRRLRAEAEERSDLVRWSVGFDVPPRMLVLTIWRDGLEVRRRAIDLLGLELGASWVMAWEAGDYEIGHWDGLRLRQMARLRRRRRNG